MPPTPLHTIILQLTHYTNDLLTYFGDRTFPRRSSKNVKQCAAISDVTTSTVKISA